MAEKPTEQPEDVPPDDVPPIVRGIPTDPAKLEAWKKRYTEDLMDHPGGIDAPWRESF